MLSSTLLTTSQQRREQQSSRGELAYQLLKEKIVTLKLAPASLLNESELMDELKLGRTPIREALQRLAWEDLVVILPRRGTIVADVNFSDLQKVFELRIELEAYTARLAAERALPQQVEEMEVTFADADEIISNGDNSQLLVLDHQAHIQLSKATQNEFLQDTIERLYTHVLRLWYASIDRVGRLPQAIAEHRDIIEAVKLGDGETAAQIMRKHVRGFQREFEQITIGMHGSDRSG